MDDSNMSLKVIFFYMGYNIAKPNVAHRFK